MMATGDFSEFAVLAPRGMGVSSSPLRVIRNRERHGRLLDEMQRLRGRIALRESAITPSNLDSSGRHRMEDDDQSWHLLRLRRDGKIAGCARILVHPPNVAFSRLRIAHSSVARCTAWARQVKAAVESELNVARVRNLLTVEPGGWVVDEDLRGTCEAVTLALGTFAWAQILGGAIGFLTATVKHRSSAILRRMGGRNLRSGGDPIPRYFDTAWGCEMELLRFDTDSLDPRYEAALSAVRRELLTAPVFSAEAAPVPQWSMQVSPKYTPDRYTSGSAGSYLPDVRFPVEIACREPGSLLHAAQ